MGGFLAGLVVISAKIQKPTLNAVGLLLDVVPPGLAASAADQRSTPPANRRLSLAAAKLFLYFLTSNHSKLGLLP